MLRSFLPLESDYLSKLSNMVKDSDQLTAKQSRELWKSEFLPAIKSEIEAVKVQLHSQITTINERLENIEQTRSLLLSPATYLQQLKLPMRKYTTWRSGVMIS